MKYQILSKHKKEKLHNLAGSCGALSENSDPGGEVVRWQLLIWLECDTLQYIAIF